MKKLLFSALTAMLALTLGCSGGANSTPGDWNPKVKKIDKGIYFQATQTPRLLGGEIELEIEWPESANGVDITPLQEALTNGTGSIEKYIEYLTQEYYPANLWKRVNHEIETDDNFDPDDTLYSPYSPDGKVEIELVEENILPGVAFYHKESYFCNGWGMGAGCIEENYYLMFDYRQGKMVTFNDIFLPNAKEPLTQCFLNFQFIPFVDYSCLWGEEDAAIWQEDFQLPETVFLRQDACFFCFSKYEMACGADGPVSLGLPISLIEPYLTPYAKSLLGLK